MLLKQNRTYAVVAVGLTAFIVLGIMTLFLFFLSEPSTNPDERPILEPGVNQPIRASIQAYPLVQPGGPAFNVTVTNITTKPISLLEIDLKSFTGFISNSRIVWFSDVNLTNPLLPRQSTWKIYIVIGESYTPILTIQFR